MKHPIKSSPIKSSPLIRIACEGVQADKQPIRSAAIDGLVNYCESGNYIYLKFPVGVMGMNFKKFSHLVEEFGWTLGASTEPNVLLTGSTTSEFDLGVLTPLCSECSVVLIDGLLDKVENNEDARAALLKLRHKVQNIQLTREKIIREFNNSAT